MADEYAAKKVEDDMLALAGEKPDADEGAYKQPLYQVIGDARVPVSKASGKLWKSRRDMGLKRASRFHEAWEEAIRYYNHDHSSDSTNTTTKGIRKKGDETENMVFSNVTTLMPMLYSRHPELEFSNLNQGQEQEAEDHSANTFKRLLNILIRRKHAPGVSLKQKVRKMTLFTSLCNIGWGKLGWMDREDSSDAVYKQMQDILDNMAKCKEPEKLRYYEGQLMALEDRFNTTQQAGFNFKCVHPGRIIVDPETEDPDLTDCNWVIEMDYLPTTYLCAMYLDMDEKKPNEEKKLLYKPTHVLNPGSEDADGNDSNTMDAAFSSINYADADYKKFGFESEEEYKSNQYTRVWYVWDRTTRRVFLFHDNDWTWPLWVWDDPYRLSRFYPYFALVFHESTWNMYAKGEVTYYLDQQDAINEINAQEARARKNVISKIIYNSNVIRGDQVEKLINSDENRSLGVALPEGTTIDQAVMNLTPPNLRYKEMFDKEGKYRAIDRIAGISEIQRGQQMKSHTTELAANMVQDSIQVRLDEKLDKIEDLIADIAWSMLEIAVQKLKTEEVVALVGTSAADWRNMTPTELNSQYVMEVVAGSTEKPTSKMKKNQALQMGQVLGQFVNASPAVVEVILRVFQRAFSEILLTEADWQFVRQSLMAQMQRGASTGQQPNGATGPAQEGGAQQQGGGGQQQQAGGDVSGLLKALVGVLPPQAKQMIEQSVQQGANPAEALVQIVAQMSGTQQGAAA